MIKFGWSIWSLNGISERKFSEDLKGKAKESEGSGPHGRVRARE